MTVIALIVSNSVLSDTYFSILKTYIPLGFGEFKLKLSVFHWINDALMAIFFLVVGLEIKREFVEGELSDQNKLPYLSWVRLAECLYLRLFMLHLIMKHQKL